MRRANVIGTNLVGGEREGKARNLLYRRTRAFRRSEAGAVSSVQNAFERGCINTQR